MIKKDYLLENCDFVSFHTIYIDKKHFTVFYKIYIFNYNYSSFLFAYTYSISWKT